MSKSWSDSGIASDGKGPDVTNCLPCSFSRPDSSRFFVNSSTNSGMPSVLATIWSRTSAGNILPPVTFVTIVTHSLWLIRLSVSAVRCAYPLQGDLNSGRNVTSMRKSADRNCSINRLISSSVDGSAHCTSSTTISTGCWVVMASIKATTASSVRFFRSSGLKASGG